MLTLAHQLRDLPGFRWAPGMLADDGSRVDTVGICSDGRMWPLSWTQTTSTNSAHHTDADCGAWTDEARIRHWSALAPDLTDAATGGILWVMAGRPDVVVDEYGVYAPSDEAYPTLGEACAALMVARGRCGC